MQSLSNVVEVEVTIPSIMKIDSARGRIMTTGDISIWSAADLLARLEEGSRLTVLDVRPRGEFERFRIEGRDAVSVTNVPYGEMLDPAGEADKSRSVASYAERFLADRLSKDGPILSVCARGKTSALVAAGIALLGYPNATLDGGMRAWGEHYSVRAVVESSCLAIYQVARPARGCLSYVLASEGEAIVVDPLRHVAPYRNLAQEKRFTIRHVIDTHAHADHISGGPSLASETASPYHLHPYDAVHPIDMVPATIAYRPIHDGEIFTVGSQRLEAMHIPGHTLGLVALRLRNQYLFTGDSIFLRSVSRPDLGGKAEAWAPLHARSLHRLMELPDTMTVLPGHFNSLDEAPAPGHIFAGPLGEIKRHNEGLVALGRQSEDDFVRYLLAHLPEPIPEYNEIKRVNAGLRAADEEIAWSLELGKNVCAISQAS